MQDREEFSSPLDRDQLNGDPVFLTLSSLDTFATVIDVGANKGQFAAYARTRWPNARLICFEPLPGPRAKLARVTRGHAEFHDCALGSAPGQGQMHLASRTDSSSLLALGASQKAIYGMEESGALQVPIKPGQKSDGTRKRGTL